ncbi:hypothetical protein DL96DRAFT_1627406 [Flagelloscypha sp. PMI_526]|nr:hypothetical protein DL96DRAFT_1627406 [Flagelloscypha sp. PMI_526]
MNSMEPNFELPDDVLFAILDLALAGLPSKSNLSLLLISKRTYDWALNKFYHTLELSPDGFAAASVDRTRLLSSASPSSLQLVRRMKCGYWAHSPFPFATFCNLTHLCLWAGQSLQAPTAGGIPELGLEELIVWSPMDRTALLGSLLFDSRLCQTLKRFGAYDTQAWSDEDLARLDQFRNLTHVLACYDGVPQFSKAPLSKNIDRDGFQCWLFVPAFNPPSLEDFEVGVRYYESIRDSRLVISKAVPHYMPDTNPAPHFWDDQEELWRSAKRANAENPHLKSITSVKDLDC